MTNSDQIRLFIEPKSIAIIGASRKTGQGSLNMVEHLLTFGYKGKIFPVNPKAEEIYGLKTHSHVHNIQEQIDLAIILTPRIQTLTAVRDCVKKGIKAIMVIGQGFADADEEGKALQAEMVDIAREGGARILGPNTLGITNYFNNLNASLAFLKKKNTIPVAVISQTGLFSFEYPTFSCSGKTFDVGNAADISFADILEYLEDDPDTKLIFLYTEGIPEGRRFLDLAERITKKKPILAIKTGRTETGKKAAASHTGSLTGEDAIYEAAFRQAGILRVKDMEEFHDLAKALLFLPPMKGSNVGIVTTSGAGGILASDVCEELNLKVADLDKRTRTVLEKVYPSWMKVGNPCDIWPAASIMRYGLDNVFRMTLDGMENDGNINAIVCLCIALNEGWGHFNIPGIIKDTAGKSDKPVIAWFFGPNLNEDSSKVEEDRNVAAYPSVERGLRALAGLHAYHACAHRRPRTIESLPIDHATLTKIITDAKHNGRLSLNVEALQVLKACKIPIPRYKIAHSQQEAVSIADEIGYPVVMKIVSPDISHKTEAGGINIGIRCSSDITSVYKQMINDINYNYPNASILGILIQKMVESGKEVIVGMKRDAHFGPVLMFGMGGIYAEVFKDVTFRIAPISRDDAYNMISEVKSCELLKGFRGEDPSDISAIGDTLLKISQLGMDFPEIQELDINPLIVLPKGKGATGVDARILLAPLGN